MIKKPTLLLDKELKQAEIIESKLDSWITRDYVGKPMYITTDIHERVQKYLIAKGKKAGWSIRFNNDQREGYWITIK